VAVVGFFACRRHKQKQQRVVPTNSMTVMNALPSTFEQQRVVAVPAFVSTGAVISINNVAALNAVATDSCARDIAITEIVPVKDVVPKNSGQRDNIVAEAVAPKTSSVAIEMLPMSSTSTASTGTDTASTICVVSAASTPSTSINTASTEHPNSISVLSP